MQHTPIFNNIPVEVFLPLFNQGLHLFQLILVQPNAAAARTLVQNDPAGTGVVEVFELGRFSFGTFQLVMIGLLDAKDVFIDGIEAGYFLGRECFLVDSNDLLQFSCIQPFALAFATCIDLDAFVFDWAEG